MNLNSTNEKNPKAHIPPVPLSKPGPSIHHKELVHISTPSSTETTPVSLSPPSRYQNITFPLSLIWLLKKFPIQAVKAQRHVLQFLTNFPHRYHTARHACALLVTRGEVAIGGKCKEGGNAIRDPKFTDP